MSDFRIEESDTVEYKNHKRSLYFKKNFFSKV